MKNYQDIKKIRKKNVFSVSCFLLLVASPLFRVGWCGNPLIAGFCRGGLWCVVWCFAWSASVLRMRVFSAASVSEEWLFWWVFECFCGIFVLFCLVLWGFLEFIADWILEKCMADKSGRFYVFCRGKRDSLGGFLRGCLGFYRATREGLSVVLRNEILS